jgi:hypothetical protein
MSETELRIGTTGMNLQPVTQLVPVSDFADFFVRFIGPVWDFLFKANKRITGFFFLEHSVKMLRFLLLFCSIMNS